LLDVRRRPEEKGPAAAATRMRYHERNEQQDVERVKGRPGVIVMVAGRIDGL